MREADYDVGSLSLAETIHAEHRLTGSVFDVRLNCVKSQRGAKSHRRVQKASLALLVAMEGAKNTK
jgi:hypothetical protein